MNTIKTESNPEKWPRLALLVIPLFLALPCFAGYPWAEGDLLRQFYPWKELAKQALSQGRLPLWNSSVFCGMPLFGNLQSALLYPPHLPFYFLDFSQALGLHLLFHFFVSGLGVYALMRSLRLDRWPALLGALCWQGNAFLLVRVEFMSALSAYAWTPWMLWAVAANAPLKRVTLLVAMQTLAGYPLELAYSFSATFLFALGTERGKFWRLLGGWGLGLAVCAVALLPGLELIQASSRLAGAPDGQERDLLTLAAMKTWISPLAELGWKSAFSVALPALILAAFARGRTMYWSLGLIVLGLGLSFGAGAAWIPNRHPSLALVFCALGLAIISSLGAQTLALKVKNPKALAAIYASLTGLFLAYSVASWANYSHLVTSALYKPAASALELKEKMTPGSRILLSPAIQNERGLHGKFISTAWGKFSLWLQANTPSVVGVSDANGYDPLAPAAVVKLLNAASFAKPAPDPWLLDLLGVETLVDWNKGGNFNMAIRRRNSTPMRAVFIESRSKNLLSLDQEMDASNLKPATRREISDRARRNRIKVIQENPETLRLVLPENHPSGWVFLNDTHYPGWRAWVDGKPVVIQKALGAFRAVKVEADSGELVMRYKPMSFYLGLILSAMVLFFIIFAFNPGGSSKTSS